MPTSTLESCVCLGGAGYPLPAGTECHVAFSDASVVVHVTRDLSFTIPLLEICSIDISGPGTVTTGGSFVGGGFGAQGALQGIAIAAVLNVLTTKSSIHTFITFVTNVGELHFHYGGMEPAALRMALASTFCALRRLDPVWQRNRLDALELERKYRGLSDADFERLAARVVQPLPPPAASPTPPLVQVASAGALGRCPSCKSTIPLLSDECPKCKAIFGADSAWKVVPL